jgi:DNA-directed RNA polymerase subunit beta
MMRQAVPLIRPEAPIVGTGLERQVASDSRVLIKGDGVIEYVDANIITIKYDRSEEERMVSFDSDEKTYNLIKFRKPIKEQVSTLNLSRKGDRVVLGQVLSEGYATQNGELALGRNQKVHLCHGKGTTLRMRLLFLKRWFVIFLPLFTLMIIH